MSKSYYFLSNGLEQNPFLSSWDILHSWIFQNDWILILLTIFLVVIFEILLIEIYTALKKKLVPQGKSTLDPQKNEDSFLEGVRFALENLCNSYSYSQERFNDFSERLTPALTSQEFSCGHGALSLGGNSWASTHVSGYQGSYVCESSMSSSGETTSSLSFVHSEVKEIFISHKKHSKDESKTIRLSTKNLYSIMKTNRKKKTGFPPDFDFPNTSTFTAESECFSMAPCPPVHLILSRNQIQFLEDYVRNKIPSRSKARLKSEDNGLCPRAQESLVQHQHPEEMVISDPVQDSVLEQSALQSRLASQLQQSNHNLDSCRSQPGIEATYFAQPPYVQEDYFSYLTQDSFQTQNSKRRPQFLKAPCIIDTVPKGQQQMVSSKSNHDSVCSIMPPSPALEGRRNRRKTPGRERKLRPKVSSLKAKKAPPSQIFSMTTRHSSTRKIELGYKNNIKKKNSREKKLLGPTSESMRKLVPSPKIKSNTEMKMCKDLQSIIESGEELTVNTPNMQSVENREEPEIGTPNTQRYVPQEIRTNSKDCMGIVLEFSGVNLLISLASQKHEDSDELEDIKVQVRTNHVSLEERKSLIPTSIEHHSPSESEEVECNSRSDLKSMCQDKGPYGTFYNVMHTTVFEPPDVQMPIKLKASTDMSTIVSCSLALKQEKQPDERLIQAVKHVVKSSIHKELQEHVRKERGQQEEGFRVGMYPKPQAKHVSPEMREITEESRKTEGEQAIQPQSVWGSSACLMADLLHSAKMKQNAYNPTDRQSTTDHMSSLTMPENLPVDEYFIGTIVYVDPFGRNPGETAYDHIAEESRDLQRDVPEAEVGSFKIRKKMSGTKSILSVKHVMMKVKKPTASQLLCVNRPDAPRPRKRLGGSFEVILKQLLYDEMLPPVLRHTYSYASSLPDIQMHSKGNAKESSHIKLTQEKSQVEREEKKLNSLGEEVESQNTLGTKLHNDMQVAEQALPRPAPFGKWDFRLDVHPGQGINTEEELYRLIAFTATTQESVDWLGMDPSHVANMKGSTPAQADHQCSADWETGTPPSGGSLLGDTPRDGTFPGTQNDARKTWCGFPEKGTGLSTDSPAALPKAVNYCMTELPRYKKKKKHRVKPRGMTKTVNLKSRNAKVKPSHSQTFSTTGNRKKPKLGFKTKLKKINQAQAFVPECLDIPYSFSHDQLKQGQPASEKCMDIFARNSALYSREGKLPEAEQQAFQQAAPQHSQYPMSDAYQTKDLHFEELSLSCSTQEQPANGQVEQQQKGFKMQHIEVKESQEINQTESDMKFQASLEIVPPKAENAPHKDTMATTAAFGRSSERELDLYPVETHSEIATDLQVTFLQSSDSVVMPFVSKFKRQRNTLGSRKQAPVSHRYRTMRDRKPSPSQMANYRRNKRLQRNRKMERKVPQQRKREADTVLDVSHSNVGFLPDINGGAYHKKDHDLVNSEEELSQSEITNIRVQPQADFTETSLCSTSCPLLDQFQVEKLERCFWFSPVTSGEAKEDAFCTREDDVLADERHHKGQASGGEREGTVAFYRPALSISENKKNKQFAIRKASVNLKYGLMKAKKPSISCMGNFKSRTDLNHTEKTQHGLADKTHSLTTVTPNINMVSKTDIENGPSGETALGSTQGRQEMPQHEGDITLDNVKETDLQSNHEEGDEELFEVIPECSQHFIFCSGPVSDLNVGKLEHKGTKTVLFVMEQDVPQQSEVEDPVKGERSETNLQTSKGTLCPASAKRSPQISEASQTEEAVTEIAQHGILADGSPTGVPKSWEKEEKAGFKNYLQITVPDFMNLSTSVLPESKKQKKTAACRALRGKMSPAHVIMKGKKPPVSKTFNILQSGCQRNLLPKILKSQVAGLLCSGVPADRLHVVVTSCGPKAEKEQGLAQELPATILGPLDFSNRASSTSNTERDNLQFMDKGHKMISPISQTLKFTDSGTAIHKKQLKCNSKTKKNQDKPVPNTFVSSPMPVSLDLNTCDRGKKTDVLWEMQFSYEPKEQEQGGRAEEAWCAHSIDKEDTSCDTEDVTGQGGEGGPLTSQCFSFGAPKTTGPTFAKTCLELKNSTTHPEVEKSVYDGGPQEACADRVQGRYGNATKMDRPPKEKEKMTSDASSKPVPHCGQPLCFCTHQMKDLGLHPSESDPKTLQGRNLSCLEQEMMEQTQLGEILEPAGRQAINFLQDEMAGKSLPIQEVVDNMVCQRTLSPKAGQSVIGSIPSDMPWDGNPRRKWDCSISEKKAWNQNDLQTASKPLDFSSLTSPEYERGNTFSNRMLQRLEDGPLTEKAELQENLATTFVGPFDFFIPVLSKSQSHVSTAQSSEIEMTSSHKRLTRNKKKPPISQILKINVHFNTKHRKKFQSNLRIKLNAMEHGDSVDGIVHSTIYFISDTSDVKRQNEFKAKLARGASRFSHSQPTQIELPTESKSAPMDKGGSDFLKKAELPVGQCGGAKQEPLIKTHPSNAKKIAVNENLKRNPNPTKSEGRLSRDSVLHKSQIHEMNPEVDIKSGKTNSMQVGLKGGLSTVEKSHFSAELSESTGNTDKRDKKKTYHFLKENSSCKWAGIGGNLPVSEEIKRQTDSLKVPYVSVPKNPPSASSQPLDGAHRSAASIHEKQNLTAPKVEVDSGQLNAIINSSHTCMPIPSQTKMEQTHSLWDTYEESSEKRKFLKASEKEKYEQKVLLSKASRTIQPFEFGADQMRQPSPFRPEVLNTMHPKSTTPQKTAVYLVDQEGSIRLGEPLSPVFVLSSEAHPLKKLDSEFKATSRETTDPKSFALPKKQGEWNIAGTIWSSSCANEPMDAEIIRQKETAKTTDVKSTTCTSQINLKAKQTSASHLHGYDNGSNKKELKETIQQQKISQLAECIVNQLLKANLDLRCLALPVKKLPEVKTEDKPADRKHILEKSPNERQMSWPRCVDISSVSEKLEENLSEQEHAHQHTFKDIPQRYMQWSQVGSQQMKKHSAVKVGDLQRKVFCEPISQKNETHYLGLDIPRCRRGTDMYNDQQDALPQKSSPKRVLWEPEITHKTGLESVPFPIKEPPCLTKTKEPIPKQDLKPPVLQGKKGLKGPDSPSDPKEQLFTPKLMAQQSHPFTEALLRSICSHILWKCHPEKLKNETEIKDAVLKDSTQQEKKISNIDLMTTNTERLLLLIKEQEKRRKTIRKNTKSKTAGDIKTRVNPNPVLTYSPTGVQSDNTIENTGIGTPKDGTQLNKSIVTLWGQQRLCGQGLNPDSIYIDVFASPEVISHKDKRGRVLVKSAPYPKTLRMKAKRTPVFQLLQMTGYGSRSNRIELRCYFKKKKALQQGRTGAHLVPNAICDSGYIRFQSKGSMETKSDEDKPQNPIQQLELKLSLDKRRAFSQLTAETTLESTPRKPEQCITRSKERDVVLLDLLPQRRDQLMISQQVEEPVHIHLKDNLEREAYRVVFPEMKEIDDRRPDTPKPTSDTELKFLIAQRVKQGVVNTVNHAISLPQGRAGSSSKGQNKFLTELEASQEKTYKELPKQESMSMADLGSAACPFNESFHLETPGEVAKEGGVYINKRNIPHILGREELKENDALLGSKAQTNLEDLPKICASHRGGCTKSSHLSRRILQSAPYHWRDPLHVKQMVNKMRKECDSIPRSVLVEPWRNEQSDLTDIPFKSNTKKVEFSKLSRAKQLSNHNQNIEKIMEPIFPCILRQLHDENTKKILAKPTLNSKVLNSMVKKVDVQVDQPLCMKGIDLHIQGRKYQEGLGDISVARAWMNIHWVMSPRGKKVSEVEDNVDYHTPNTEKGGKKQKCADKILPKPESPIKTSLRHTNAQEQLLKLDAENMMQVRKALEELDVVEESCQSRKKGRKQQCLSISDENFGKHLSGSQNAPHLQPHLWPHGKEALSEAGAVFKRTKELDSSRKAQLSHAEQHGLERVVPLITANQMKEQKPILPSESGSSNKSIKCLNILSPQRKQSSDVVQVIESMSKLGVRRKVQEHNACQKEQAEVYLPRIFLNSPICIHLLNKNKIQNSGVKQGLMKDITCQERILPKLGKLLFPDLFSATDSDIPSHHGELQWKRKEQVMHMKRRKERPHSAVTQELSALPYFRTDKEIDGVISSHARRPRVAQEEEECGKAGEGTVDSEMTLDTEKSPRCHVLSKKELPLWFDILEQQSKGQDSAGKSDMEVTTSGIYLPCLPQLNVNSRIEEGRGKSGILKNCLTPPLKPQLSSKVRKVSFIESCNLNSAIDSKCLAHKKRECRYQVVDLKDIVGLICTALRAKECSVKYLQHRKEQLWNGRNEKQEKVIQCSKRNLDLVHNKHPGSILPSPHLEWDAKIKEAYTQGIKRFCLPSPTLQELSGTLGMEESTDDILSSIKNAKYRSLKERWDTAPEEIMHSKRIASRAKPSSVLQELGVNVEEKEKNIQENAVENHSKSCMTSPPNSEADMRATGEEVLEIKTKFSCLQSEDQEPPAIRKMACKKSTSLPILNNVKDPIQNVIHTGEESTKVEKDIPLKRNISSLSHKVQLDSRDQKKTQQKSRDERNMVVTDTSTLSHLKLDTRIPCQKPDELKESKELVDGDASSVSHKEKAHLPQGEEDEAETLAEKILHMKNGDWQESKAPSQVLLLSPKEEGKKTEQKKANPKSRNQEKMNEEVDEGKVDLEEHEQRKMDAEGKQQEKMNTKGQDEENMDVDVEGQDIWNKKGTGQGKAEGESQRQEEIGPETKEQKKEQEKLDSEGRQKRRTGREVKEKEEMGPDRGWQEREVKEEEEMGLDDRQEGKVREPDGGQQAKAEVKEEEGGGRGGEIEADGGQKVKAGKVMEQEEMDGEGRLQGREVKEEWKMAAGGGLPGRASGSGLKPEKVGPESIEQEIGLREGEDQGKVNRSSRNQGKTNQECKRQRSVLHVYISAPSSHRSRDTVEGVGLKGIPRSPSSLLRSQKLSDAEVTAQTESLGDDKWNEVNPVQEYKAQNGVAMKHTASPKDMTSKTNQLALTHARSSTWHYDPQTGEQTNINQNSGQVLGQVLERQGELGEVPIVVSSFPSKLDNGKVQKDPPGVIESYLSPSQNMESSDAQKLKYSVSRLSAISRDSNTARSTTRIEEDKEETSEKSIMRSKDIGVEGKKLSLSRVPQTKTLPVNVSEHSKERQEGGEEMVVHLSKTRLFVTSSFASTLDVIKEDKEEAGTLHSHVQEPSSTGRSTVASTESTVNHRERGTQHPPTEDDEGQALATNDARRPNGPGLQAKTYELPWVLRIHESSTLNTISVPPRSHKEKARQKQEGTRYPNVVLTKLNHFSPSPSLHRLSPRDKLSLSSRAGELGYAGSNEDIASRNGIVTASRQRLSEETKDRIKREDGEDGELKGISLQVRISPPAHRYDREMQRLSIKEQREGMKGGKNEPEEVLKGTASSYSSYFLKGNAGVDKKESILERNSFSIPPPNMQNSTNSSVLSNKKERIKSTTQEKEAPNTTVRDKKISKLMDLQMKKFPFSSCSNELQRKTKALKLEDPTKAITKVQLRLKKPSYADIRYSGRTDGELSSDIKKLKEDMSQEEKKRKEKFVGMCGRVYPNDIYLKAKALPVLSRHNLSDHQLKTRLQEKKAEKNTSKPAIRQASISPSRTPSRSLSVSTGTKEESTAMLKRFSVYTARPQEPSDSEGSLHIQPVIGDVFLTVKNRKQRLLEKAELDGMQRIKITMVPKYQEAKTQEHKGGPSKVLTKSPSSSLPYPQLDKKESYVTELILRKPASQRTLSEGETEPAKSIAGDITQGVTTLVPPKEDTEGPVEKRGADTTVKLWKSPHPHKLYRTKLHLNIEGRRQKEHEGQDEPQSIVIRQIHTAKPPPTCVKVDKSIQGDKESETSSPLPLRSSALADVKKVSGTKALTGDVRKEKDDAALKKQAVNMTTGMCVKKARMPPISQILASRGFTVNMKVLDQSQPRDRREPPTVLTRTFLSRPPASPFPVDSQNKEKDTEEIASPQQQLQDPSDAQETAYLYSDPVHEDSEDTVKEAKEHVLPGVAARRRNAEVMISAQNKSEHLQVKSERASRSPGDPIHFTGVSIIRSENKLQMYLLGKKEQPEEHEKGHLTTFHSYPSLEATNMGDQKEKTKITDTLCHKVRSKLLIPLPMKTSQETFVTLDTPVNSKGFPATQGDARPSRTSSKLSPEFLGSGQFDKLEKDKQNSITISKLWSPKLLTLQKYRSCKKINITKPSNPQNTEDSDIVTKQQVVPPSQSVRQTSSSSFISFKCPLQNKLELPRLNQNIREQKWSQRNVSTSLHAFIPLSPRSQKGRSARTNLKTEVSTKDLTMGFPIYPIPEIHGMEGNSSPCNTKKLEHTLSKPKHMASCSQDASAILRRTLTVARTPENEETFTSEIVIRKGKQVYLSKCREKSPGACEMKDTLMTTKGEPNGTNPDAQDPQASGVKMQKPPHVTAEENFVSGINKINITLQIRKRLLPGHDDSKIIKNPDTSMMEQEEKCILTPSEQRSLVVEEFTHRTQMFDTGGCSLPPNQREQGDDPGRVTTTREIQQQETNAETVATTSQVEMDERKMLKECLFPIYEAFKTIFEASVGNIITNKFPSGMLEKVQACASDVEKSPSLPEGPGTSSRKHPVLQCEPLFKHLTHEEKSKLTKHLASKIIEIKLNLIPEMAKISLQKFNFHSQVDISEDNSWRLYPRSKEMNFISPGVKEPNLKCNYQKDSLSKRVLIAVSSGNKEIVTKLNSIEKLENGTSAAASASEHPLPPVLQKYSVETRDKLLMHLSRKSLELQSETFPRIVSESYAMVNAQDRPKPLPKCIHSAVNAPKQTNRIVLLFDKKCLCEVDVNLQQKYLHAALGLSSKNTAPVPNALPKPTPKLSSVSGCETEAEGGGKCALPTDKGLVQQPPFSFQKQNRHDNSVLFKRVPEPSQEHTFGPDPQRDSALGLSNNNMVPAPQALPKPTLKLSTASSCKEDDGVGKCALPIDKGLAQQQPVSFKEQNLHENSLLFKNKPSQVHNLGPDLQGVKQKDTTGLPEFKSHMTPGNNNKSHELFQKTNAYKPSDLCTQQNAASVPDPHSTQISGDFTDLDMKTESSPNLARSEKSSSAECVFLETNFYLSQESNSFLFKAEKGIPLEKFFQMKEAAYLKPFHSEGSGIHQVRTYRKHSLHTSVSSCDSHGSRKYRPFFQMQSSELVCHSSRAVEMQSASSSTSFREEKVSWTTQSGPTSSSSSGSSIKSHHVKDRHKPHHTCPESKDTKKTKFGLLRKSSVHWNSHYSHAHSEEKHTGKKKVRDSASERSHYSQSHHKSTPRHHGEDVDSPPESKPSQPFFYACIPADSLDTAPKTIRWMIPQETLRKRNFRVPLVAKISNTLAISSSSKKLLRRLSKVR